MRLAIKQYLSIRNLFRDRRGVAALLFALALPPILLATGAAVDFARVGMVKTSLQSVADGAALAGASALCLSNGQTDATQAAKDYFNKGTVPLSASATVGAPTVTIPSSIEVTVTATATVTNTLMKLVGMSEVVSVTSSAQGPSSTMTFTNKGGFSAYAWDSNSIYVYVVSANGSVPTSTSSMTLLFTNDPAVDPNYASDNTASKTFQVGQKDYVGFALVNKTGGLFGYGSNSYGAAQGTTHYFYSSVAVPSMTAYPTQPTYYTGKIPQGSKSCQTTAITSSMASYLPTASTSCYPHPCTEMDGSAVMNNNLLVGPTSSSSQACSTPSAATVTCAQLQQTPTTFAWNDMGANPDDYDYNDAVYSVSCSPPSTASQTNDVVLVQ